VAEVIARTKAAQQEDFALIVVAQMLLEVGFLGME
jgi:hypothetical protein